MSRLVGAEIVFQDTTVELYSAKTPGEHVLMRATCRDTGEVWEKEVSVAAAISLIFHASMNEMPLLTYDEVRAHVEGCPESCLPFA